MIQENWQLVTNEPVESGKNLVEVEDCRKITDHFREIYRIYPNLIKENQRVSTCNRLELQTLGSLPLMPKVTFFFVYFCQDGEDMDYYARGSYGVDSIPPSTSLRWNIIWHKARHKKRLSFLVGYPQGSGGE